MICGLQDPPPVRRLPRATQLKPIPGLPPVDAHRGVPTRVPIDVDKRIPMTTPTLRRPSRIFSAGTAFLVAGATAAAWAGYFVIASWPPAMDFVDAPRRASSETRLVTLSALWQAVPPSIELTGLTAGSEAEHEPQLTMNSEGKAIENGIEARFPQTLPATEYRATMVETSAMPESNSVRQALPRSSADAAPGVQDAKPPIERGGQFFAASVPVSTCFPSASTVRQEHPEAWPSWTLQAPGHEGTRCWYAATRATARDHRSE